MRKIFIITERRADYSRFQPILSLIKDDPELEYDLVVTGLHLKHDHGYTINEIKSDGFKIFSSFEYTTFFEIIILPLLREKSKYSPVILLSI